MDKSIQVKVWMQMSIDPDEYPIPSDGDVTEEIDEAVREYFHDISGIKIKNLRVSQQEINYE